MSVTWADVLRSTGSQGQRKGLDPFANKVVYLDNFKIEKKGRDKDRAGNPKEQKRVLTTQVNDQAEPQTIKPRRARVPVRYANRIIELMDLRADDAEPLVIRDVRVVVGEHGATLQLPEASDNNGSNGEARKPGRPRRQPTAPTPENPQGSNV